MNMQTKALEYSYRIHWSPKDHGYVASVAEFPSLMSRPSGTPQAAADLAVDAVIEELSALHRDGQSMPAPLASVRL